MVIREISAACAGISARARPSIHHLGYFGGARKSLPVYAHPPDRGSNLCSSRCTSRFWPYISSALVSQDLKMVCLPVDRISCLLALCRNFLDFSFRRLGAFTVSDFAICNHASL